MNAIQKCITAAQRGSDLNKSNDCHSMSLERTAGHINSFGSNEWMHSKNRTTISVLLLPAFQIVYHSLFSKDWSKWSELIICCRIEKKTLTKTSEINGVRLLPLWCCPLIALLCRELSRRPSICNCPLFLRAFCSEIFRNVVASISSTFYFDGVDAWLYSFTCF